MAQKPQLSKEQKNMDVKNKIPSSLMMAIGGILAGLGLAVFAVGGLGAKFPRNIACIIVGAVLFILGTILFQIGTEE